MPRGINWISWDELEPGHAYKAVLFGGKTVLQEILDYAQLQTDAALFWEFVGGRLFLCDQCGYYAADAQGVQEHSTREHNCKYVTYEVVDHLGAHHIRVETIKCHSRANGHRRARRKI